MAQQTIKKLGGKIANWLADEAGNSNVDWVFITSGVVAMTIAILIAIGGGLNVFSEKTETELAQRDVGFD